jgi:hypothetical protein
MRSDLEELRRVFSAFFRPSQPFALEELGTLLNSEDETGENSGWATVELPIKATVGKTISLLKEAK